MQGMVPEHRRRLKESRVAAVEAAEARAASGGPDDTGRLQPWWARRQGRALATMLRIDASALPGVSITSQTGRALRLRQAKLQSVC